MKFKILEPPTVGETLSLKFLKPLSITQQQLADAIGVSRGTISRIVNNSRRTSVCEAAKLAAWFETSKDFWINLQAVHDRWQIRQFESYFLHELAEDYPMRQVSYRLGGL